MTEESYLAKTEEVFRQIAHRRNLLPDGAKGNYPIYGRIELENGQVLPWLRCIDAKLSLEEAKKEAIRLVTAAWKGVTVRCWCVD